MYTDSQDPMQFPRENLENLSPVALYKRHLMETLRVGLPEVQWAFFGPAEHPTMCNAIQAYGGIPRTDTCIVEFDGYWIREMEDKRLITSLKEAAPSDRNGHDWLKEFLTLTHVKSECFVPHYVDMGLFVSRVLYHERFPEDPVSWENLKKMAED